MVNVFFFETPSVTIERGSPQEAIANFIYEKRRAIEIMKSVSASITDEDALHKALKELMNAIAPEIAEDDERRLENMSRMIEGEQGKVYNVSAADGIKNTSGRIVRIKPKRRTPWRKR